MVCAPKQYSRRGGKRKNYPVVKKFKRSLTKGKPPSVKFLRRTNTISKFIHRYQYVARETFRRSIYVTTNTFFFSPSFFPSPFLSLAVGCAASVFFALPPRQSRQTLDFLLGNGVFPMREIVDCAAFGRMLFATFDDGT